VVGSEQWITDLTLLKSLVKHADDVALQQRWMAVKLDNKKRLAALIKKLTGATVSTDALFDIQVRRSSGDVFRCYFLPSPSHIS
jgi:starch phosphorylase